MPSRNASSATTTAEHDAAIIEREPTFKHFVDHLDGTTEFPLETEPDAERRAEPAGGVTAAQIAALCAPAPRRSTDFLRTYPQEYQDAFWESITRERRQIERAEH